MMCRRERKEWRGCWRFVGRRVREALLLAAWVLVAWLLEGYLVYLLPISGPPRYLLYTFEGAFDLNTLA